MDISPTVRRGGALVALAGLFTSAFLTAPGTAAVDGLNRKEKKQGDRRWVTDAEAGQFVTEAESSAFQPDIIWAHIAADGTILGQSGGISVTDDSNDGRYFLHFPTVVNGKGILATPDWSTRDGDAEIYVAPCGGGTEGVNCGPGSATTSDLYVETADSTGANTDTAFYVAVIP